MEYMPEFQVLRPTSLDDAVALRADHPDARFLAGGTDLLVNVRRGIVDSPTLIDLGAINEMREITERDDGGLKIGCAVTLAELLDDPRIKERYPAIIKAAGEVAGATHREVATLGGNLCLDTRCVFYNQSEWWRNANNYCLKYGGDTCHVAPSGNECFAAFSGDIAPAILIFSGEIEVAGPGGRKSLPLNEIYNDDGMAHLRLGKDEVISSINLPAPEGWCSGYRKIRVRGAIDFPLAGVAIALKRDGENLSDIRVGLTGTNARPILLDGTDSLIEKEFNEGILEELLSLIPKQIQPMTSTFTPPGYRRKVVANMTRALAQALFDAA